MTDDKPLSNVVAFPSLREMADSGGPVSRVRKPYDACRHDRGVTVDDVDRVVTCKRCGKSVDAFDALESLAASWDWERTREAMQQAQQDAEKLYKEVDALKRKRATVRRTGQIEVARVKQAFKEVEAHLSQQRAQETRDRAGERAAEAIGRALYIRRDVAAKLYAETGEEDKP